MSYTVTVWEPPAGSPPPADTAQADALLAQQARTPPGAAPLPRFLELGRALYTRFAPSGDDEIANDVWLDGSEEGDTRRPTLTFGLLTGSRFFEAAYLHAVAEARAHGLNLYDPQSGEHFLTDGRVLRGTEPSTPAHPLEDDRWAAEAAWRQLDWAAARTDWRTAAAEGSTEALHELGRSLVEGRGSACHRVTGTALMVVADVEHPPFRRAREAAVAALDPLLAADLAEAVATLRTAPDRLAALDARLHAEVARRDAMRKSIASLPAKPKAWPPATLDALRREAADGMAEACNELHHVWVREPEYTAERLGIAPADAASLGRTLALAQAAAAPGDENPAKAIARHLLLGSPGWPLDPAGALVWLRRAALASTVAGVNEVIANLVARRERPWDPVADRARAQAMLASLDERTPVNIRLAKLRRACELDHPEAWRQLGRAYQRGELGLTQDLHAGNALVLTGHKSLATSGYGLTAEMLAEVVHANGDNLIEAQRLGRRLIASPDPWGVLAADQKRQQNMNTWSFSRTAEGRTVVEVSQTESVGPKARAKAEREAQAARRQAQRQGLRDRAAQRTALTPLQVLHSVGMVWVGAAGAVLWLGRTGQLSGGGRVGLALLCGLAAYGAWRCAGALQRGALGRLIAAGLAALPMLGLLQAAELTYALWQHRERAAPDDEAG